MSGARSSRVRLGEPDPLMSTRPRTWFSPTWKSSTLGRCARISEVELHTALAAPLAAEAEGLATAVSAPPRFSFPRDRERADDDWRPPRLRAPASLLELLNRMRWVLRERSAPPLVLRESTDEANAIRSVGVGVKDVKALELDESVTQKFECMVSESGLFACSASSNKPNLLIHSLFFVFPEII